jgi:hypothetical protein
MSLGFSMRSAFVAPASIDSKCVSTHVQVEAAEGPASFPSLPTLLSLDLDRLNSDEVMSVGTEKSDNVCELGDGALGGLGKM